MKLIAGCVFAMGMNSCAEKTDYVFMGERCEQGIVTEMNVISARAVFPQVDVGSVIISQGCYQSRIIRPTVESIEKRNK